MTVYSSDGTICDIPVDENGGVTWEAALARFSRVNEYGDHTRSMGGDLARTAKGSVVFRPGMSPSEIADWWAHPNQYDPINVDDKDFPVYSTEGSFKKTAKPYQRKIAVLGDHDERVAVRRTLDTSFIVGEEKDLADSRAIYKFDDESNKGFKHNQYGEYDTEEDRIHIKSDNFGKPRIVTIIHETVHKLRRIDDNRKDVYTASKLDERMDVRNGKYGETINGIDKNTYANHLLALEEAATECETVARTSPHGISKGRGSYYCQIDKDIDVIDRMRDEDRMLLVGNADPDGKGLKGKAAIKAVRDNYENTNISRIDNGTGMPARKHKEVRRK